jgi:type VI secretion system protein ImpE
MNSYQLYQEARLDDAIQASLQEVKSNPLNADKRLFLCDLLCLAHELQRADKQLETLGQQDSTLSVGVSLYRQLIRAAQARSEFYESGRPPEFMEEVPEILKLHLRASIAVRDGSLAEANDLLQEAETSRVHPRGLCNGEPFEDFRDLDDLTSPVLEVLTSTGKYYWVSWDRIESLAFRKPKLLRDLIWRPTEMSIRNGLDAVVYVPAIYYGSHRSEDPRLRCGLSTDWVQSNGGPAKGVGQRMYLVGNEDRPLMTLESISFSATDSPGAG